MRSTWHDVDDLRTHARVGGDIRAPPVVLVHGLIISSRYMEPLAQRLLRQAHVHSIDLPGFGRTARIHTAWPIPRLAEHVAAWMDVVGLERAHFIGNSAGCQVIAALAARRPERVEKVVLQGPTVDPAARRTLQQVARWCWDATLEPPIPWRARVEFVRRMLLDYAAVGPIIAQQALRRILEDRIEERLPRVRAETLVVRGQHDVIVPQPWAETAARLVPQGVLRVVPGAAHTMPYFSPLELARVAGAFLGLRPTEPTVAGSPTAPGLTPLRPTPARSPAPSGAGTPVSPSP